MTVYKALLKARSSFNVSIVLAFSGDIIALEINDHFIYYLYHKELYTFKNKKS